MWVVGVGVGSQPEGGAPNPTGQHSRAEEEEKEGGGKDVVWVVRGG